MRRKDDGDNTRKKHTHKEEMIELSLEMEISILLQYLKIMPMSIRAQFLPTLANIVESPQTPDRLRTTVNTLGASCHMEPFDSARNTFMLNLFCRFLKLNKLKVAFGEIERKKQMK